MLLQYLGKIKDQKFCTFREHILLFNRCTKSHAAICIAEISTKVTAVTSSVYRVRVVVR